MFRFFCKVWSENFRINDLVKSWINLENRARKKKSLIFGGEGYILQCVHTHCWCERSTYQQLSPYSIRWIETACIDVPFITRIITNDSIIVQTTNKLMKYISTLHQSNHFKLPFFILCDSRWQHCRQSVTRNVQTFLTLLFKWRRAECVDGKEVKVTNLCRKLTCESVTSLRVWE